MMLSGEIFLEEGLITHLQLQDALAHQHENGGKDTIGTVLVKLGLISERDRVRCLGKQWGVQFVDLATNTPTSSELDLIPGETARRYKVVPVSHDGFRLVVAMINPLDIFAIDEIRLITGLDVEPMIATEEDVLSIIQDHYKDNVGMHDAVNKVIGDFQSGDIEISDASNEDELSVEELRELGEEAPIIRLANLIITQAINDKASDIHIEPTKDCLQVRYRIDGIMLDGMTLPKKVSAPLTSRFKIMAEMDIAEKRVPQDNRISAIVGSKEYDFRVSTLPTVNGEKIVMRVLDKANVSVGVKKLGLMNDTLTLLKKLYSRTYGILLVTGPTGSGKSTTLYSILSQICTGQTNIITIEDPVEYEVGGINQVQVNVKAGMTFAAGLRAMLRQDPDIIMVGEMRDRETATIAMEAALTGHFVLSTLHTNDAPSAATRLIDMEVEPFLIASSIIGVLAQRLVRTLCPKCKKKVSESRATFERFGFSVPIGKLELGDLSIDIPTSGPVETYQAVGCDSCKGSGYKGRMGIHELMEITDDIRDLVLKKTPSHMIRQPAVENGMRTLQVDAACKVLLGLTSLEEVVRVLYAG